LLVLTEKRGYIVWYIWSSIFGKIWSSYFYPSWFHGSCMLEQYFLFIAAGAKSCFYSIALVQNLFFYSSHWWKTHVAVALTLSSPSSFLFFFDKQLLLRIICTVPYGSLYLSNDDALLQVARTVTETAGGHEPTGLTLVKEQTRNIVHGHSYRRTHTVQAKSIRGS